VPGCCAVIRRKLLKNIKFEHDTVTEDLDITLKIHKLKKKIDYEPKAVVYTTDPHDIKSYIRQIKRWHRGAFQNIKKHKYILVKGWLGGFEIPVTIFEGIFFGSFFLISPILAIFYPRFVISIYIVDFIILTLACVYGIIKMKRFDLIVGIPATFMMRAINNIIWIWAFVQEIILRKKSMVWHRADR